MKIVMLRREVLVLLTCFIVSRICIKLAGVSFGYQALYSYWQYLDVESLKHNLLSSLWYQHAQPPVFNFIAGIVLKCSGQYAHRVFELLFLGFSFVNACLLMHIIRNTTRAKHLPLIVALLYLLSPATMLFEHELFYTSFISMLLLLTAHALMAFQRTRSWKDAAWMFLSIAILCLTKSLYHLAWLFLVSGALLIRFYNTPAFKKVAVAALLAIVVVTGWYAKNWFLFNSFSASSWTVGKNHEKYVQPGIETFTKRITHYYPVEWHIIPSPKNAATLSETDLCRKEGEMILNLLKTEDFLVVLDEHGKQINSEGLAELLQVKANESTKQLVFLIGGAYGLDQTVLKRANFSWSLSKLVFPHQLVRLILAEQIYRACTILRNEKYHHS